MTGAAVPHVLRTITVDPGRPRLTWYGPAGERIELSGHVLDNWVTKTANLLVEEYDTGPGTRVLLDLPPHWRTVVWALAVWRTGAQVVLDRRTTCDVVVTHRPGEHADPVARFGAELVAVALPALARSVEGDLPPGTTDANSAVMTYGDVLTYMPEPDPSEPALTGQGDPVRHADLLTAVRTELPALWPDAAWVEAALAGADQTPPDGGTQGELRVLLEPAEDGVRAVLAAVLSVYAQDGSVVLCAPEVAVELAQDAERRERIVDGERVTADAQG